MRNKNVFSIAALLGWTVSVKYVDGSLFFDFHRKTLSGVPFSFTAEMKDRKLENLIKEIESFVDAIDPETCAGEWMIQSGAMAPSRYQQAVNDMDTIRTDAWLLACELREADGKSLLAGLPRTNGTDPIFYYYSKTAFYRDVLSLNLRPFLGETCRFIGKQVASPEYDASFIGMDPDKRKRTFLMSDVVIDGTPMDAEEDTGFLHGISFFREYHNRLYLLYIVHKYSFWV